MAKRIIDISLITAAAVLIVMITAAVNVYAAGDLTLDRSAIDMDSDLQAGDWCVEVSKGAGCYENIDHVKVSSEGVFYPHVVTDGSKVRVQALGLGSSKMTVVGTYGSEISVNVKVGTAALTQTMEEMMMIQPVHYGDKTATVEVLPGSTYAFSVVDKKTGKEKTVNSFAQNEQNWISSSDVSLAKVYDLGSAITLLAEKDGCTAKVTAKVTSMTEVVKVKASGKTFSVKTFNLHKGDKVKIKYSGKTYNKKITSNKHAKYYTVKFKAKKKIAKNAKLTFWIDNQYGTKLFKKTAKLYNYTWTEDE